MPASTPTPRLALARGAGLPFPQLAAAYLEEYLDKIRLALGPLDDEALWWRPAPGTNSAGNLVVHLAGNLSLWVLAGVGGEAYERDRAGEFAAGAEAGGKEDVLARLATVVERCALLLRAGTQAELERPAAIQGYSVDVRSAVFHAVEHMSYHTGQIVWIAKQHLARERPGDAAAGPAFEFYPHHAGE